MSLHRPTLLPIDHWSLKDRGYEAMRVTSPYADRGGGFHAALDIGNARLRDVLTAVDDATVHAVGFLSYPWSSPKPADSWWIGQPLNVQTGARGGLYGPPSRWDGPMWGGLMIVLRLSADDWALYAHCSRIDVRAGQSVKRGQRIGLLGESGSAYHQGHLHFGIVHATEAQLDTLRERRTPVPRAMTRDPWPLIAASAGSSGPLPDTSTPEAPTMDLTGAEHQLPKLVQLKPGTRLRKLPTADSPEHFTPPDAIEVEVLLSQNGYHLGRRYPPPPKKPGVATSAPCFWFTSDDIQAASGEAGGVLLGKLAYPDDPRLRESHTEAALEAALAAEKRRSASIKTEGAKSLRSAATRSRDNAAADEAAAKNLETL